MGTQSHTGPLDLQTLLAAFRVDRQALATDTGLKQPFETLRDRAYEIGRAEGVRLVAQSGGGDAEDVREMLDLCHRTGRQGENEREGMIARSYADGIWQSVCLLHLELVHESAHSEMQNETERFRLSRGEQLEAEIDVLSTRVRDEWRDPAPGELDRLIRRTARMAILIDIANQKARDRLLLLVTDLARNATTKRMAIERARARLLNQASTLRQGDRRAFLYRQAYAYLTDEHIRGLLPKRSRR